MKSKLTVTKDFTKNFNEIVGRFKFDTVLVGVPEEDGAREDQAPINNATLLAICNFGSPSNNIPAWPVMSIGINNAQEAIAEQFKRAAQGALSQGFSALDTYYNRAGIIASNSIKKVLNSQEDVPDSSEGGPKPEKSTLAARKRRGFKGTKYWVVTGQMRNSITYVIRGKK